MHELSYPKYMALYDRADRVCWVARTRNGFLLARLVPSPSGYAELYPWPLDEFVAMSDTKAARTAQNMVACYYKSQEHMTRSEAVRRDHSILLQHSFTPPRYLVGRNGDDRFILRTEHPRFVSRLASTGQTGRLYDFLPIDDINESQHPALFSDALTFCALIYQPQPSNA